MGSSLQPVGSFIAACRLFTVVRGLLSNCGSQALERVGSVVVACRLSCPVACGTLVPQPGIEPTSPALEGGFLTTGPPGKSLIYLFIFILYLILFLSPFSTLPNLIRLLYILRYCLLDFQTILCIFYVLTSCYP